MDAAIQVVRAYLQANGYFTVTEYPIIEALEGGGYRAVTDIDVLAVRLPGAGAVVWRQGESAAEQERAFEPDPRLIDEHSDEQVDFIIAEVKEGRAELNRGGRRPNTIIAALRRFAFVEPARAEQIAHDLLKRGHARIDGARVRMFAFGTRLPDKRSHCKVVLLKDCLKFLQDRAFEHSDMLSAAQLKDPALGMFTLLSKAGMRI